MDVALFQRHLVHTRALVEFPCRSDPRHIAQAGGILLLSLTQDPSVTVQEGGKVSGETLHYYDVRHAVTLCTVTPHVLIDSTHASRPYTTLDPDVDKWKQYRK